MSKTPLQQFSNNQNIFKSLFPKNPMIISVDTKHDSHDDIKKVIAMLRHYVGEQGIVTNAPSQTTPEASIANLFDMPMAAPSSDSLTPSIQPLSEAPKKSDADLFSDLFSAEDLPEAEEPKPEARQEDEEAYSTSKKPKIEFY